MVKGASAVLFFPGHGEYTPRPPSSSLASIDMYFCASGNLNPAASTRAPLAVQEAQGISVMKSNGNQVLQ